MSFSVNLYTFSKRVNSTKRPTGNGTAFDCILKDGCSVVYPEIQLQLSAGTSPASYNYAYISSFGRYYYISDWYFEDRLWTAKLKVDPMATYKSSIGAYSGYVVRSSAAFDGNIIDTYYPVKSQITEVVNGTSQDPGWSNDISDGCFVVGIMGNNSSPNGGAVTYYVMSPSAMHSLTNWLLDTNNYTGVTDITADLLKCIINPLQYIVSCMWFPFSTVPGTNVSSIKIGWWDVSGVSALQINKPLVKKNLSFTIPKHPQSTVRGNFLNLEPFSSYILSAGPWGLIKLNNINLINDTTLSGFIYVDTYTGSGRLVLDAPFASGAIVEDHFAQIGVPIQLGQNTLNQGAVNGVASGALGVAGSAATGNILGMIGAGLDTIGSVAELSQSIPTVVGSNGSMAFNTAFKLLGRFADVAPEDLSSRGRPLCQVKTMSSIAGYIVCADADPQIAGSDYEQSTIVSYMNSGFYYE